MNIGGLLLCIAGAVAMASSIPSILAVLTTVIGLSLAMYSTLLWIRQCFDWGHKNVVQKNLVKIYYYYLYYIVYNFIDFFDIKLL